MRENDKLKTFGDFQKYAERKKHVEEKTHSLAGPASLNKKGAKVFVAK